MPRRWSDSSLRTYQPSRFTSTPSRLRSPRGCAVHRNPCLRRTGHGMYTSGSSASGRRIDMHVIALGYVGVEARDSRRWIAFAEEVLGLRATETEDGLVLLRMDERAYRIAVHPGNRDGLAYLGWELPNVPALERAADELTQQGVTFERGTEDECARRQVRGLLRFVDPAGSPLELFCGQRFNSTPFLPTRPVSGFLTGPLGMGHVVIRTPEAQATADFYTNVLGFRISDYFADRLIFLHCNGRHHSVAFGNLGPGRGLSHIMLEAKS